MAKRLYKTGRTVKRVPQTGLQVVEYKERPGEYYSIDGELMDESYGVAAGFDVVRGRMERRRRELMSEASRRIEKQIREEQAEIEERLAEEEDALRARGGSEVHVQEGAELRAVHRGGGVWRVEDATGAVIADRLTKAQADGFISDAAAAASEQSAE